MMKQLILKHDCFPDWVKTEVSTGTTLIAVEYDGGVILGADSRTSSGSYVANRFTDKLTKLTDFIYCCRSGSAADTQALADAVTYNLDMYRMQLGEEPSVLAAANVMRDMCYNYRDQLSAGIIIAGWDRWRGGQVYTIPLGGMMVRQPIGAGGSGSTYLWGYIDDKFKPDLDKESCFKFVKDAVTHAINRDGSSGGCIRLACISKEGVERRNVLGDELPRFYEG